MGQVEARKSDSVLLNARSSLIVDDIFLIDQRKRKISFSALVYLPFLLRRFPLPRGVFIQQILHKSWPVSMFVAEVAYKLGDIGSIGETNNYAILPSQTFPTFSKL